MPTRPSSSREPSTTRSLRSLRISIDSSRDVFSDDHELDSPVTIDDAPLTNVPQPRQQYFDNPFNDPQTSTVDPYPNLPQMQTDRTSTTKPRLMVDDVPTTADGGLGRTLSTSSRITIPRSQSPYNGPTAPSHPYTMYPQMTRASSVASESTLRPGSETPFVPHAGPQHPYQLYPQNTVPEEDEDITTNGIPLGFPRTNFQSSNGRSNSDVGDIIGSDGHIEQLPPYSRYADNTVAKGNMDDIVARRRSMRSMRSIRSMRSLRPALAPSHSSQPTTQTTTPSVATSTTLLQPTAQFEEETEAQRARKEGYRPGWGEQLRKPTIAGMPLWGLIVITLMIIFSATIGGVVGGIIGNKQGAQRALANG